MSVVQELERELHDIEADRLYVESKLREAAGRQRIGCCYCDRYTAVKDIEVLARYQFVENLGCPAGTGRTYLRGHHYLCPKCHCLNRANIRFNEIAKKYIKSFKGVTDEQY